MQGRALATPPAKTPRGGSALAEEMADTIRGLLDRQQLDEARQLAALAVRQHPDHSWLKQADRVLNPTRITSRPARGRGRQQELAWLRRNAATFRGQWVALSGEILVANAKSFQEIQRSVLEQHLDVSPLIHYVD